MKKSLRQKITSILMAVFLLTVIFLAFMQFSQKTQNNIDEYAEVNLNEIIALQKKSIYSNLTANMDFLNSIAVLLESQNLNFEQARVLLENTEFNYGFHQLVIVNADGSVATSDNTQAKIVFDDVARQFESKEPIYFEPINSLVDDEYILPISYPIYDNAEEKVKYILVEINTLEELQSYVENTFDKNGNIGIFNSKGELIFSNQLSNLNLSIRKDYISRWFSAITAPITTEQLYADLQQNNSGSFIYKYNESDIFFKYAPLGINDWYVAVHLNKVSVVSRVDLASRDAFEFLFILVACVIIVFLYIYIINSHAKKELSRLAFYDELTGLSNGVYFKKELEKNLKKDADKSFYCIVFDICNFKIINDRFGYAVGDKVLCTIADTIKETLKRKFPNETAIISKLHSDTFVMLVPATTIKECDEEMEKAVNRIRINTGLMQEFKLDFHFGRYITQHNDTTEIALERALNAHAYSKSQTPNRFIDFDDVFMNKLRTNADIINSFDEAIANEEFQIYFQPQFLAKTKKIHGTEILVRWIKDGKIRYTPDVFIPVLENAGNISKLDSYLREKLCIAIRGWLDNNIKLPHFSVNVSRVELIQPDFISKLKQLLNKYNIPPAMIHIELTETAYTDDQEGLASKITQLQECGFLVEMDDFGSGYSSLNVLKDISVDIVKLDMKLIETCTTSSRSYNILTSIVHMAQSINLITIAEGVETQEQVDYLESIGCSYLQGFFFAKPMSINDYIEVLKKNNIDNDLNSTQEN